MAGAEQPLLADELRAADGAQAETDEEEETQRQQQQMLPPGASGIHTGRQRMGPIGVALARWCRDPAHRGA